MFVCVVVHYCIFIFVFGRVRIWEANCNHNGWSRVKVFFFIVWCINSLSSCSALSNYFHLCFLLFIFLMSFCSFSRGSYRSLFLWKSLKSCIQGADLPFSFKEDLIWGTFQWTRVYPIFKVLVAFHYMVLPYLWNKFGCKIDRRLYEGVFKLAPFPKFSFINA